MMPENVCQWSPGNECFVRIYGNLIKAIVKNVDLHTLRLKVIYSDGVEVWVYMERCYKMSEEKLPPITY
jgi:hypothetical protein